MPGEPVRPSGPTIPGGPRGPRNSGAVSRRDKMTLELHPHWSIDT